MKYANHTVFIYINIQLCKQTTTICQRTSNANILYLSISIYNFASKPQRLSAYFGHSATVFIYINIQLCKQTTTLASVIHLQLDCIYLYQYTTLQANHNSHSALYRVDRTVFIYINIQLCKQTTTAVNEGKMELDCIYLYQYTTLQANHNSVRNHLPMMRTVFIYINIQLCKQTTTSRRPTSPKGDCIYLYQYTTLQANHN